jgi:hypothetical protein
MLAMRFLKGVYKFLVPPEFRAWYLQVIFRKSCIVTCIVVHYNNPVDQTTVQEQILRFHIFRKLFVGVNVSFLLALSKCTVWSHSPHFNMALRGKSDSTKLCLDYSHRSPNHIRCNFSNRWHRWSSDHRWLR